MPRRVMNEQTSKRYQHLLNENQPNQDQSLKTHTSHALNPHELHQLITVAVHGYPKRPDCSGINTSPFCINATIRNPTHMQP